MNFVHPERLWLLAALPVLVLWAIRGRWRRRRSWEALAQRGRPPREGALWWLCAIACLMVALAQPKWGRLGSQPPPGHDTILLIDISRSMGAEDAVPNRLAVAVEYAEKLVDALGTGPTDRAAVVAFAGRAVRLCPLTENLGAVIDILRRLRPGMVQPGGTDLGGGLEAALEAMGDDEHAEGQTIVVFSDGEDLAERWKTRLERLVQREVVVHAVTIGDAEHDHEVPTGTDDSKPMTYRGQPVRSRRSDTALQTIAGQTGGVVIPLGLSTGDPTVLYRNQIEPAARRRARTPRLADMAERFPLFLVAALSCLVAACWPPGRGWSWSWSWRMGLGWAWSRPWRRRAGLARPATALTRAALAMLAAATIVGAGQPPEPGPGSSRDRPPAGDAGPDQRPPSSASFKSAREAVARGQAAYGSDRLEEALAAFEAAARAAPAAAIPHYDAAAVLFRMGRFEEARSRYLEAREHADAALRTKIDYALGNTALCLGDVPGAIAAYDACIASTARGAGLDVVRHDAEINREFAYRQAQSPAIPQGQGPDDPSQSGGPDRRRSPDRRPGDEDRSPDGEPEAGPSDDGGGANPESDRDGREHPRRRRRAGGGGGSRTTPPGAAGESPDDRLDAALDSIRAAQARRLPEEPPPSSPASDGRDW